MKPFMTRTAIRADHGWTYHGTARGRGGRMFPVTDTRDTFGSVIVGTVFPFLMDIFRDGHVSEDLTWWVTNPDGRNVVRANVPPLPGTKVRGAGCPPVKGYAVILAGWEPDGNPYGISPLDLRFNHLDPALEAALGALQVAHIIRGTFAKARVVRLTDPDALHAGDTVLEAEGWFGFTPDAPEHVLTASFFPPDRWEALTGRQSQKETRTNERPR